MVPSDRRCGLARSELAADLEEGAGLTLPGDRVLGSRALTGRQLSHHETGEQQEEQVEELAEVGDRECVARLDEVEVVEKERRDRRDRCGPCPRHDRGRNDCQEVERRRVRDPEPVLEHADRERGTHQRRHGNGHEPQDSVTLDPLHGHDPRGSGERLGRHSVRKRQLGGRSELQAVLRSAVDPEGDPGELGPGQCDRGDGVDVVQADDPHVARESARHHLDRNVDLTKVDLQLIDSARQDDKTRWIHVSTV